MKVLRSASQILFGYLPEQTVDLEGRVWKVREWRYPKEINTIDLGTLRRELVRQAYPWRKQGQDAGYVTNLEANHAVRVLELDVSNGVQVEQFPNIWMCKACKRILNGPAQDCPCCSKGRPGQLHFVGYHDQCGAVKAPWIPRCTQHKQARITFPGTTSAAEIIFDCPVCKRVLRKGFGTPQCDCGAGSLKFTVHRAASVYTPRTVVIVNPPSQEKIRAISEAGGPPRALSWVVNGMEERTAEAMPLTAESLKRNLQLQNLPTAVIDQMVKQAAASGALATSTEDLALSPERRREAEAQAVTIALAASESRLSVSDIASKTEPTSALGLLYRDKYPTAIRRAGLSDVELYDKFPVLTGSFGYTRGSHRPGASRLVPFRRRSGEYIVYADLADTEALFVRLDPLKVHTWLTQKGHALRMVTSQKEARVALLEAAVLPDPSGQGAPSPGADLLTLVHSYAHRFIRMTAYHAGIDQQALSELLVPLHLGFFVYAAAKGDFVLGGLQALFEGDLDTLLDAFVFDEHRCPLDPGCSKSGGACMACLHLGEPSCRLYNRYLNREVLAGAGGYLQNTSVTQTS